ncbi:MAG: hypothetical protein U0470_07935 [Anaerolineae bacterium]
MTVPRTTRPPRPTSSAFVMALGDLRRAGINGLNDRVRGPHAIAFSVLRIGRPFATPYHLVFARCRRRRPRRAAGPDGSARAAVLFAVLWLMAIASLCRACTCRSSRLPRRRWRGFRPCLAYGATPYAELFAGALALSALAAIAATRPAPRAGSTAPRRSLLLGSAVVAKIDLLPLAATGAIGLLLTVRELRPRLAFGAACRRRRTGLDSLAVGPMAAYVAFNGYGRARRLAAAGLAMHGLFAALVAATALTAWAASRRRARRRRGPLGAAPGGDDRTDPRRAGRPAAGQCGHVVLFAVAARAVARRRRRAGGMPGLLGWSISPLALFAAIVAVGRRLDRRNAAPFGVWPMIAATAFVLAAPIVTRDLSPIYTVRRLAPIALPTACLLAAGELAIAMGGAGWRRAAAAATVGLALFGAAAQAAALRPGREFGAAEVLIDRIAAYARPGDLAVFPSAYGDDATGRLAAPLWALRDVDVAVLPPPGPRSGGPSEAAVAIRRWLAAHPGRRALWIADPATPPPSGLHARALGDESLITEGWAPGVFPPAMKSVEFAVAIGALGVDPDNSR